MKNSVFAKNLGSTVVLLLLTIFLLGGVFAGWSYQFTVEDQRNELSSVAEKATHVVSSLSGSFSTDSFEMGMSISILGDTSHYTIMLTDCDGTILSCSDSDGLTCDHLGLTLSPVMMDTLAEKGSFRGTSSASGIFEERRYMVVLPLMDSVGATQLGYLIVSSAPAELAAPWRTSSGKLVLVAVIVAIIALLISYFNAKHLTSPINQMTKAADSFARGDFSSRVEVESDDEIGRLADSFNLMADSLERSENLRREFISDVSHELKTPMTTISGFADGILDGTIPPDKEKEYLEIISFETRRLSRLVRNMLDVSKLTDQDSDSILKQHFDLTEVVCQTLLSLEKTITDRNLDVDADFPEDSITVLGDRDAITQVVYNLLDNAAKFADSGSTLRLAIWKQSGRAYVSIEDTGAVIPEDDLPMIFDRFHKSDKSRSMDKDGVGLGLYIVKTILDRHREDIFVTSGNGITKFTFTLTIAPQS